MTEDFNSMEDLAKGIAHRLDTGPKKKILALYAFNTTGKTRLTNLMHDEESSALEVLRYDAFLEDIFIWDNENRILKFDPNSWIIRLVNEQGLENNIIDNFKDIIRSNIEPSFNLAEGSIAFNIASGDDDSLSNIKISKGEESIFIWSVFYTVLETAIDILNDNKESRTTDIFNDLKYVIIDDPVSSMDDTKIITMTIRLAEKIKISRGNNLKFFTTTHHALFYNVFVNSLKKAKGYNLEFYSLIKDNGIFKLSRQGDSPFSYHLYIKTIIQNAIIENSLEKYHFNLFRNLLEKTSNFLGYDDWADCISGDNKQEFVKLLNLYSHNRLADLEPRELSAENKNLFQDTFALFINDFKWK